MTDNLFIQEKHRALDENHDGECIIGESDVYETWTNNRGKLFRELQKEHGRCSGRMYIDCKDGSSQAIGWVFLKRKKYEDCTKTYLHETWVTLHNGPPTKSIAYDYATLN